MKRLALVATVLALGGSFALAQQDPIAARKAVMKKNGDEAKIGTQFMKGEAPFDLAKARRSSRPTRTRPARPTLFPDNSEDRRRDRGAAGDLGEEGRLRRQLKKFGEDAKEAEAKVTDEASFKVVFPDRAERTAAAATKPIA
jgi:cytochrome c556